MCAKCKGEIKRIVQKNVETVVLEWIGGVPMEGRSVSDNVVRWMAPGNDHSRMVEDELNELSRKETRVELRVAGSSLQRCRSF